MEAGWAYKPIGWHHEQSPSGTSRQMKTNRRSSVHGKITMIYPGLPHSTRWEGKYKCAEEKCLSAANRSAPTPAHVPPRHSHAFL